MSSKFLPQRVEHCIRNLKTLSQNPGKIPEEDVLLGNVKALIIDLQSEKRWADIISIAIHSYTPLFAARYKWNDLIFILQAGIDSCESLRVESKPQEEYVFLLHKLGSIKRRIDNFDDAVILLNKAEQFALELDLKDQLGAIYYEIAMVYQFQNDIDTSIKYQLKSKEAEERIGNRLKATIALGQVGGTLVSAKRYEEAFKYSIQAYNDLMKMSESDYGDERLYKQWLGNVNSHLGDIFLSRDNIDKAEEYFLKSKRLSEEIKNSYGLPYCEFRLAKVKARRGHLKEALEDFVRTLDHCNRVGFTNIIPEIKEEINKIEMIM